LYGGNKRSRLSSASPFAPTAGNGSAAHQTALTCWSDGSRSLRRYLDGPG